MPRPPDNGRGRGTNTPASNLQQTTPAPTRTTTALSLPDRGDAHCPRCACRCGCHRPPEPPYVWVPPRPGSWEWSGYLAELSAELGTLEAAYAAVDPLVVAAA